MKKTGNKMCEAFATSIELGDLNIMGQANTELINNLMLVSNRQTAG
jgi:hypothetical protein